MKHKIHFRYVEPSKDEYIHSAFFLKTRLFTNCSFKTQFLEDEHDNYFYQEKIESMFGSGYRKIRFRHFADIDTLQNDTMTDVAFYPIPAGQEKLKDIMLFASIGLSIIVAAYLLITIVRGNTKEKVN